IRRLFDRMPGTLTRRAGKASRRRAPARLRPSFELLEDRLTPSTFAKTSFVEGRFGGNDSVFLVADGSIPSTFSSNVLWLHPTGAFLSAMGSGLATFSFDPNTGILPRTGTLSLDDQTLTVTQAGSSYNAASPLTTLVSSGLASP